MPTGQRRAAQATRRRQALSVGLVALLAGWLFVWNATPGRASDMRDAPGLRGLVTARDREVEELQERQAELAAAVEALVGTVDTPQGAASPELAVAAGTAEVAGPGLTVTLDDADRAGGVPPGTAFSASDLLVHQQDIDAVMNALWAGGAEVVAVQGHRVTSATVIKCVGNVVLVAGRVYSPPYLISAIGPAAEMRDHLDVSPAVHAYRERASRLGLTWGTVDEDKLTIPGDTLVSSALRYARAIDSTLEAEDWTGP
ncbi:MAG: DUF881 domain-containing protein [Bifidobacteriaceae bacterium]|jgi:uncharacterized protein YlxW (UPF0749 family)|nr:DUF881 domain-containing protein [Bifidobacteriaceae bacterium]